MRDLLTADDIYSHIMMLGSAQSKVVVLIEGDGDDDCLGSHVDRGTATLIPVQGKPILLAVMERVDQQGLAYVLAIVDRDFDSILGIEVTSENVVMTDLYDLDSTILQRTNAGKRVIHAFARGDLVDEVCTQRGADGPIEVARRVCEFVGLLRLRSLRDGLDLPLRSLPLQEVMSATGDLSVQRLSAVLAGRTKDSALTETRLRELVESEREVFIGSLEELCSGHDLGAALAVLARGLWGANNSVGQELILKSSRAALSCAELQSLQMFEAVRQWAASRGRTVWHEECAA